MRVAWNIRAYMSPPSDWGCLSSPLVFSFGFVLMATTHFLLPGDMGIFLKRCLGLGLPVGNWFNSHYI